MAKSWDDLEQAALTDVYLHAAVHAVRNGKSREAVLTTTAVVLSEELAACKRELTASLATCICGAVRNVITRRIGKVTDV